MNLNIKCETDLLKSWLARALTVEKAHFRCCARFRRNHYILGTVLITASSLTSAITALVERGELAQSGLVVAIRVSLAILVPVAAALVTFLKFEVRSAEHHNAAARFAALKRKISLAIIRAECGGDLEETRKNLDAICRAWDDLTLNAPALYQDTWEKEIEKHERKIQAFEEKRSAVESLAREKEASE